MVKNFKFALLLPVLLLLAQPVFAAYGYAPLPDKVRSNPLVANLIAKNNSGVQVVEFFSYGCSACARFEPQFAKWQGNKPQNVNVYRLPVTFNDDEWRSLADLYFIMQDLGAKDLNSKVFSAIHQQGLRLWEKPVMQKFFVDNGYSAAAFEQAYAKYSNNTEAHKADQISDAYGVDATPTLVVNGPKVSYLITADQNTGDFFNVLQQAINAAAK